MPSFFKALQIWTHEEESSASNKLVVVITTMTQPDTKSWRSCQDSEPRKKPIKSSDTGQASAVPDTPARPRRLGTHTLVLRLHLAVWVQMSRANMAKTTHTDKITKIFLHWSGHQRVLMHIRQIYENGRGYDLYHIFLCNTNLFCTPSNVPKSEITVQKQGKKSECLTLDMWMCCHTTSCTAARLLVHETIPPFRDQQTCWERRVLSDWLQQPQELVSGNNQWKGHLILLHITPKDSHRLQKCSFQRHLCLFLGTKFPCMFRCLRTEITSFIEINAK